MVWMLLFLLADISEGKGQYFIRPPNAVVLHSAFSASLGRRLRVFKVLAQVMRKGFSLLRRWATGP